MREKVEGLIKSRRIFPNAHEGQFGLNYVSICHFGSYSGRHRDALLRYFFKKGPIGGGRKKKKKKGPIAQL